MVFGPGQNGPLGHHGGQRYVWDTSLFGLNPQQFGSEYFNDVYVEGSARCVAKMQQLPEGGYDDLIVVPGMWDSNYQHFLTESLALIHYATKVEALATTPILVHDQPHVREALSLMYPGRSFVYCTERESVFAKRALYFTPITRNFDEVPPIAVEAMKALRDRVISLAKDEHKVDPNRSKIGYFGRRERPEYAGRMRTLANQDELFVELQRHGARIDAFDGLSLTEKAALLFDVEFALSPIGANLMNFLFAPEGAHLLVIGHPRFATTPWFERLFAKVGVGLASCDTYDKVELADPSVDYENAAYKVDAAGVGEIIEAWKAARA
jgi:capsular polysaccharide biosynthesis protein